jgi:glyoxylase-like metal-dependent hydrolase (beta-lactamase superfamily II)
MRLSESLFVVGGGANGLGISETYDSAVYLIASGPQSVLIDAGCGIDTGPTLRNIGAIGRDPSQISHVLLTHCHADHAGAAAFWRDEAGARIAASEEEAPLLEAADEEQLGLVRARADGSYPHDYRLKACPADVRVRHQEGIDIGGLSFTPIHVPGHSRGSVCYLADLDGHRCLFSGDVVFCGGWISVLNCPGSSLADYGAHITRLSGLEVDALLPGHFGFTLGMGQSHIDRAIHELRGLWPPRHLV